MNLRLSYRPALQMYAYILLLLIVYNAAGHVIVFTAVRHAVRQEIKALLKKGVPEGDLHILVIPFSVEHGSASSFMRIHEGEFRYEGKMYDIVRKEVRNDTTVYHCINDTAEEQLYANLDEHVRAALPHSSAAKSTSQTTALKLVIKEAIPPSETNRVWPGCPCAVAGTGFQAFYTIKPDIPTPPPRLFVS